VRTRLDAIGVKTVIVDIGSGDLSALPQDFTYVLHLAYFRSGTWDLQQVYRVNGDGTGFVLSHCRKAKAVLYMSSHAIYAPPQDPFYPQKETDRIGAPGHFFSATSSVSKIVGESVAGYCAREFNLPVTMARLNTAYAPIDALLPTMHLDTLMADKEVVVKADPAPCSPIHVDDMCDQLEAMLDAARVPATIVNWAGDEIITAQDWCRYGAELGRKELKMTVQTVPGLSAGSVGDVTKRRAITGPCKVAFKDGFRRLYETRYDANGQRRTTPPW
jgi:nucleoside-diphosphate-sugar epimerase